LIAAFTLLVIPKDGLAQAKTGSMTGFIYGADKATPVESAVVKVRDVKTGREFQSNPTDKTGLYSVKNLPEGRYIMGVSGAKGDYNFDYELMVKAGEIAKLAVALTPVTAKAGQDEDQQRNRRKAFFLTPLGIAVLVAAGGVLIYGGIQLFGEGETSPSKK
jgi:hypothetical protein